MVILQPVNPGNPIYAEYWQTVLKKVEGLYTDTIDAVWGPNTRNALKQFFERHSVQDSSLLTNRAQTNVAIFQSFYNFKFAPTPRLPVDGISPQNSTTRAAVESFQRDHNPPLVVDGVIGTGVAGMVSDVLQNTELGGQPSSNLLVVVGAGALWEDWLGSPLTGDDFGKIGHLRWGLRLEQRADRQIDAQLVKLSGVGAFFREEYEADVKITDKNIECSPGVTGKIVGVAGIIAKPAGDVGGGFNIGLEVVGTGGSIGISWNGPRPQVIHDWLISLKVCPSNDGHPKVIEVLQNSARVAGNEIFWGNKIASNEADNVVARVPEIGIATSPGPVNISSVTQAFPVGGGSMRREVAGVH